jgi:hypothetical protein
VFGLPSVSACWIAVIGRQRLSTNLHSHAATPASAIARFASAKSRAFSTTVLCFCFGDDLDDLVVQRRRRAGAGAVVGPEVADLRLLRRARCAVFLAERLTSLNAAVYSALVSAGGGADEIAPRRSS